MKQLLVIIFCLCIFVPETARIIAGTYCSYTIINEDADPVCACTFNSVPTDFQQTSFPDSHKQLLQQTDWQYISNEALNIDAACSLLITPVYPSLDISFMNAFSKSIFRPPCC